MFIIIFLLSSQLATKHCNIVPISPLSLTEHSVFLVVNHDRMLSLLFTSLLVIFHEFILCVFFLAISFFSLFQFCLSCLVSSVIITHLIDQSHTQQQQANVTQCGIGMLLIIIIMFLLLTQRMTMTFWVPDA